MANTTATTKANKDNVTDVTDVTDAAKSIKTFKHNSDIESFYRFIHENGLRREAGLILTKITDALGSSRKKSKRKNKKVRVIQ